MSLVGLGFLYQESHPRRLPVDQFFPWIGDGRGKEGGAVLTVPLNSELQQAGTGTTGRVSGRLDDLGGFFHLGHLKIYGFYSWRLESL